MEMDTDLIRKKTHGKAEENKKAKKEALTSAAFDLFTSKGINKTSIADIAECAKVAKGTFYLYFADKYDIRNFLIANKAGTIFNRACSDLKAAKAPVESFEGKILFLVSDILDQFVEDPTIVRFLSKNLSWGIFKHDITSAPVENGLDFRQIYTDALAQSDVKYQDPEVMLFLIIELVSSASYSAILFHEPLSMPELKPSLLESVRAILQSFEERGSSSSAGSSSGTASSNSSPSPAATEKI